MQTKNAYEINLRLNKTFSKNNNSKDSDSKNNDSKNNYTFRKTCLI